MPNATEQWTSFYTFRHFLCREGIAGHWNSLPLAYALMSRCPGRKAISAGFNNIDFMSIFLNQRLLRAFVRSRNDSMQP